MVKRSTLRGLLGTMAILLSSDIRVGDILRLTALAIQP